MKEKHMTTLLQENHGKERQDYSTSVDYGRDVE